MKKYFIGIAVGFLFFYSVFTTLALIGQPNNEENLLEAEKVILLQGNHIDTCVQLVNNLDQANKTLVNASKQLAEDNKENYQALIEEYQKDLVLTRSIQDTLKKDTENLEKFYTTSKYYESTNN